MPSPATRAVFTRYAVAWAYLVTASAAEIAYHLLPVADQQAVLSWASTNVHNLQHDPAGCMIGSAFFSGGPLTVAPLLIALALFGPNHALGNWRIALTCAAGHIAGTLISEGILWYRIAHGTLPGADMYIIDVGPSYIAATAVAVGLLYGNWPARAVAAAGLALLISVDKIFAGLSHLDVAPVGHVTALAVGAVLGGFLMFQRRRAAALQAAVMSRPASR